MQDFTGRTLRTWAVAQVVYSIAIAFIVIVYIPWKTPLANSLALLYAALHGVGAIGLWKGQRWGWRVSLVAGLLGLAAAVFLCSALLASWAYLSAVFGDFGRGASLAALLFASVALQLLGLFPALQLRALLRREVRADMGAGRGIIGALWGHLSLPCLMALVVFGRYELNPMPPISQEGRDQALAVLRSALEGSGHRPEVAALEGVPLGQGPLYATLWHRGRNVARVSGRGDSVASAVLDAAEALEDHADLDDAMRRNGRLKIDRVAAVGPVVSEWGPILALSVNPGLDGLRRCHQDECKVLLPDDLMVEQRFGAAPLIPGIREIRLGLHTEPVLEALELESGQIERIRTESWIEHEGQALAVVRGNTPTEASSGAEAWRRAAIEGGDFILRQLMDDGRFHYINNPLNGRNHGSSTSSLPRHAGTVYALALLYGHTKSARFRLGAERGIAWLVKQIPARCGRIDGACVVKGRRAQLGATALTVVGILEYQRRTGDDQYAVVARRLVEFLRAMQRPDGDFHHLYDIRERRINEDQRQMFASEEAALALVMAHEVLGETEDGGDPDEDLRAAERALDYLTSAKYDYFLGRFMYGADHWTCIAAEEAYPRLRSRQYLDFCRGYAEFMGRIQYQPGAWSNGDFAGHYGFGTLMVPQAPAAAGFSEAIVSTAALSRHHGVPEAALMDQVGLALDALTRDQIREDNAYLMRRPSDARGGIRRSLVEQEIRIDFTQHAASALIRGSALASDGESETSQGT